jgi:type IV pilus assembly protein PilQ
LTARLSARTCASAIACAIALGCGGEIRTTLDAARAKRVLPPPRAAASAPAAPMPSTAFRSDCESCDEDANERATATSSGPARSRFDTRRIGGGEPAPRRYTGRPVNLDLKNADLQEAFRLVADVGKVNIVVDGGVSGTITVKLERVPWDQALEVIARSKSLAVERDGNVILVRPPGGK